MYPYTVNVSGQSLISVEPNQANIQLGVVTIESQANQAQQSNAATSQQVIQSILSLHIPRENIQTVEYTIFPQYDFHDGVQQFQGYQVTHIFRIQTDDINQLGSIVDLATSHGANRIERITFSVKNRDQIYQQALQIALSNAYEKACSLAQTMRVPLQPIPIRIIEDTVSPPVIPYHSFQSQEMVAGVSTPIEAGKIDIEAELTVTFRYTS